MGKQVKKLSLEPIDDEQPEMVVEEKPVKKKLDLEPYEEPVKKKESILPSSSASEKRSAQQSKPSGQNIESAQDIPTEEQKTLFADVPVDQSKVNSQEHHDAIAAYITAVKNFNDLMGGSKTLAAIPTEKRAKQDAALKQVAEAEKNLKKFDTSQDWQKSEKAAMMESNNKDLLKEIVHEKTALEKNNPVTAVIELGKSAIKTFDSGLSDQIPKEYYTQRLRMSKGNFGDLFDPRSDLNAFGDKLPKEISRDEFNKWNNKQAGVIRTAPYDEKAKYFIIDKLGEDGYERLKKSFEDENVKERVGFERDIQEQNVQASRKIGSVVQSLKDVDGAVSALNFVGNMLGQVAYQAPKSILTGSFGSIVSEQAAIYDAQVSKIAEREGISREEVVARGLDKPAEGMIIGAGAGLIDTASSLNMFGLFRKATQKAVTQSMLQKVVKDFATTGTVGGVTEATQSELEEYAASKGSDTEYKTDSWRALTSFIGGGIGEGIGGSISSISPEITAKAATENVDVTNISSIESEAKKVQDAVDSNIGAYDFSQTKMPEKKAVEEAVKVVETHPELSIGEINKTENGDESGSYQLGNTVSRNEGNGEEGTLSDSGSGRGEIQQSGNGDNQQNVPGSADKNTTVNIEDTSTEEPKQTTLGKRVAESQEPDQIKENVAGKDKYIPRKVITTNEEAREILNKWNDTEFAERAIRDTSNVMPGGTRGALAANLYEDYKKQAEAATTPEEKASFYDKAADIAVWTAQNLTKAGQETAIAGKIWKSIMSNEDLLVTALEKQNKAQAAKAIDPIRQEVQQSKEQIEAEIRKQVNEQVEARLKSAKLITAEKRKKISDSFDALKIKDVKGTANDITRVLGAAIWNGSVDAVKAAVLTGADVANAIQSGIDYIKSNFKGEFSEDEFRSALQPMVEQHSVANAPKVQKAIEAVNNQIAELERKIQDKDLSKKERKPAITSPELEQLREKRNELQKELNRMRKENAVKPEKVDPSKIKTPGLSGKRKKDFIEDVVEAHNKGELTDEKFEELYAKRVGFKPYSSEDRARIRDLAKIISEVEKFNDELKNNFTPENISKHKDLLKRAQKANKEIQEYAARNPSNVWDTLGTIMQGNLLTPLSVIVNVYSNVQFQNLRFISAALAQGLDLGITGLAKAGVLSKAMEQRTIDLAAAQKGYFGGAWNGSMEGLRQIATGQLPDDKSLFEINGKFDPVAAWRRWSDVDRTKAQKINDAIEGTFGVPAEAMFRFLNLGDKPFRRAAEMARAAELASLKGLKGKEALKFMMFPDPESAELISKHGKEATFQNDTAISKMAQHGVLKVLEAIGSVPVVGGPAKLIAKSQVPFVRTPINILVETMTYAVPHVSIPIGMYQLAKGNKREGIMMISKGLVGLMIWQSAKWLLQAGLMTWGGDKGDDKGKSKERKSIMYDGQHPNSLNVSALRRGLAGQGFEQKDGDIWIDYKKMGPQGILLQNYANQWYHAQKEGKVPFEDVSDLLVKSPISIASTAMEQSFLAGTNAFLKALEDPEGYAGRKWMINTTEALASTILPNTVSATSKASDQYIRDTRDDNFVNELKNTFKNKLFIGDSLPAKVNLWGEKVEGNPEGRDKYAYYLFDPTKFKEVDTDSFKYKIYTKWKESGFDDKWLPSMPQRKITVNKIEIPLTPTEYEKYSIAVGQARASLAAEYLISRSSSADVDKLAKKYEKGLKIGQRKFLMDMGWNVLSKQALEQMKQKRKK